MEKNLVLNDVKYDVHTARIPLVLTLKLEVEKH